MLSERIKRLRQERKISQTELAGALNVTKQCASNWENDNVQPSVEMLVRLAQFFSVSTDYLLGLDDKRYIEVSGLTEEQITHVQAIINDIAGR